MIFISDLQILHTNKQTQACKIKIKGPREEAKDHIPIRNWRVASSHEISSNIQRNQNNEISNITLVQKKERKMQTKSAGKLKNKKEKERFDFLCSVLIFLFHN